MTTAITGAGKKVNLSTYQYTMDGRCIRKMEQGWICGCLDTRRDYIVGTGKKSLLCMDREGGKVREIRVPGAGGLRGVVYCEERDVYVVEDIRVYCLWYIDAGSGAVVRKVGSKGKAEGQLIYPYYLCHHQVSEGECHIYVSDHNNHCIRVYTASGDYIRRFGSQGSGDRQLSDPLGVCVDGSGRVVVCDMGNKRVVRYWWELWDVILTPQQLGGGLPLNVQIAPDSHIVVGTHIDGKSGSLVCYNYQ